MPAYDSIARLGGGIWKWDDDSIPNDYHLDIDR